MIDEISRLLQKELPELRGFSAQNMRNMRLFYEEWNELAICQTVSGKLEQAFSDRIPAIPASDLDLPPSRKSEIPADKTDIEICQSLTGKLEPNDSNAFMSIGFSHHTAIIRACKSLDERLFYIRNAASGFWSYRSLLQHRICHPTFRLRLKELPNGGTPSLHRHVINGSSPVSSRRRRRTA